MTCLSRVGRVRSRITPPSGSASTALSMRLVIASRTSLSAPSTLGRSGAARSSTSHHHAALLRHVAPARAREIDDLREHLVHVDGRERAAPGRAACRRRACAARCCATSSMARWITVRCSRERSLKPARASSIDCVYSAAGDSALLMSCAMPLAIWPERAQSLLLHHGLLRLAQVLVRGLQARRTGVPDARPAPRGWTAGAGIRNRRC